MIRTGDHKLSSLYKLKSLLGSEISQVEVYCSRSESDHDRMVSRRFSVSLNSNKYLYLTEYPSDSDFEENTIRTVEEYEYFSLALYPTSILNDKARSIAMNWKFPLVTKYFPSLQEAVDDFLEMIDIIISETELLSL